MSVGYEYATFSVCELHKGRKSPPPTPLFSLCTADKNIAFSGTPFVNHRRLHPFRKHTAIPSICLLSLHRHIYNEHTLIRHPPTRRRRRRKDRVEGRGTTERSQKRRRALAKYRGNITSMDGKGTENILKTFHYLSHLPRTQRTDCGCVDEAL